LAAIAVLSVIGCSSEDPSQATNQLTGACPQAGMQSACGCPTGVMSSQVCAAGPTGAPVWGACSCNALPGSGGSVGAGGQTSAGGTPVQPGTTPLPCDIQTIFDAKCKQCHQQGGLFGAPMNLASYEDVHAAAKIATGKAVFESIAARIQIEGTGQMPPPNVDQLTPTEKTSLLNWIGQGAPAGTACGGVQPGSGGVSGGNGGTAGGGAGGTSSGGSGPSTGGNNGVGAATGNYPYGKPPSDCKDFYSIHAHGAQGVDDKTPFTVRPSSQSNGGNTYTCFYYSPPYAPDSQGLWFHPDLDKLATLHHWLLYATDSATHASGSSAPCQAVEPGAYLIAGWAPGNTATNLPADVGLHMPTGTNAGLILEVHDFNTSEDTIQDASGVTFCTAPANTRAHTAGVSFTGSEGICIQPHTQGQVGGSLSVCNPPDTQDIHIISIWPHMHKLGNRMNVSLFRKAGNVEVLHDKPFDFNTQVQYPQPDVVLKAGDTMQTTCYYNNTTEEAVHFGERTQDEMCYGFIVAWPYQALQADPATIDGLEFVGQALQQVNRCMKLTSILDSCNGLGDYPVAK
jgi:cytochrome c5